MGVAGADEAWRAGRSLRFQAPGGAGVEDLLAEL